MRASLAMMVVYDSATARDRALVFRRGFIAQLPREVTFSCSWWDCNEFSSGAALALATQAFLGSSIVIISVSPERDVSQLVSRWTNDARDDDRHIAILINAPPQQTAHQKNAAFPSFLEGNNDPLLEVLRIRANATTRTLREILDTDLYPNRRSNRLTL